VDCVLFVAFVKEEPKRCQGVHFRERTEKTAGQQTYFGRFQVEMQSLCKGQFFKKNLKAFTLRPLGLKFSKGFALSANTDW
jgi:hypothetical protein